MALKPGVLVHGNMEEVIWSGRSFGGVYQLLWRTCLGYGQSHCKAYSNFSNGTLPFKSADECNWTYNSRVDVMTGYGEKTNGPDGLS